MNIAEITRIYFFEPVPGQHWVNASHDDHAFVFIHKGEYAFRINRKRPFVVRAGELVYLPARCIYSILPVEGAEAGFHCSVCFNWRGFGAKATDKAFSDLRRHPHVRIHEPLAMYSLYKEMFERFCHRTAFSEEVMHVLFERITLMVFESMEARPSPQRTVFQQMLAYLDAHFAQDVTRDTLASEFRYTPQYINSLFRQHLGMNINEYVNRRRCIEARQLLMSTSLLVKEVAQRVGYADPLYFSRVYRKVFGESPRGTLERA